MKEIEKFLRNNQNFLNKNYSRSNYKITDQISSILTTFPERGIGSYVGIQRRLEQKFVTEPIVPTFNSYVSFKPNEFHNKQNMLKLLLYRGHVSPRYLYYMHDRAQAYELANELEKAHFRMNVYIYNLFYSELSEMSLVVEDVSQINREFVYEFLDGVTVTELPVLYKSFTRALFW